MSTGSDLDHLLRVDDNGEREIVHLADCPRELRDAPLGGIGWEEFTCPVGYHLSYWGFDDLTDENGNDIGSLQPGDYKVVLDWYTPESMFEDSEVNFYVLSSSRAASE